VGEGVSSGAATFSSYGLGPHAICTFEKSARFGDELFVRHLRQSFDAGQPLDHQRRLASQPRYEFGLRSRRAGDEKRFRLAERVGHIVIIRDFAPLMSTRRASRRVVQVAWWVRWVDDLLVGVIRIKVDNSSLVMIDPDDGMIMGGQGMLQDRGFRASQSHAAGGGAL
jgi:hypothetical protein